LAGAAVREREHEAPDRNVGELGEDGVGADADLLGRLFVAELFDQRGLSFCSRSRCGVSALSSLAALALLIAGSLFRPALPDQTTGPPEGRQLQRLGAFVAA
jgi:hypothetical protein